MYLLFEVADKDLMIIAGILFVILVIAAIVFKIANKEAKVRPISEDERYDSDIIEITDLEEKTEITKEQQKAKEELERVFKQMSADLEKETPKEEEIDAFEREQEQNAIISYKELMRQAGKAEEYYEKPKEKPKRPKEEMKKEKTFQNSYIISPIYGIQSEKKLKAQKIKQKRENHDIINDTYAKEAKKEENKNVDFLNSLKEFRKNL